MKGDNIFDKMSMRESELSLSLFPRPTHGCGMGRKRRPHENRNDMRPMRSQDRSRGAEMKTFAIAFIVSFVAFRMWRHAGITGHKAIASEAQIRYV